MPYLPEGASILDFGCGSGRDAKRFIFLVPDLLLCINILCIDNLIDKSTSLHRLYWAVFILGRSQVNVTTALSGDEVGIIHNGFSIEIIQLLTEKENYVRGCTVPLYAMETAIKKNDNVQKHLPETYKAGKGIFVITTDGLETSSKNYTYEQIRKMISAKKECGWEFLFPGANIDAEKEAEKIGIAHKLIKYTNSYKKSQKMKEKTMDYIWNMLEWYLINCMNICQ